MKIHFYPSDYFIDMVGILKDTMLLRRRDYVLAIFLWVVIPLIPVLVFSWYVADIIWRYRD